MKIRKWALASVTILTLFAFSVPSHAYGRYRRRTYVRRPVRRYHRRIPSALTYALRVAKSGRYLQAAKEFYLLSIDPRFAAERMQIRYLLGLTLYQLKLYQTAAFQFVEVVQMGPGPFLSRSLEWLSLAADKLGSDALLNYAIARIRIGNFPPRYRDILFYRIGQYKLKAKDYQDAIRSFQSVRSQSNLYFKAQYQEALAYASANQNQQAINVLNGIIRDRQSFGETDLDRVAALMGKARVLYQAHQWSASIEAYREIPHDTPFWHEALFESTWAMLRAARFRSALSNFASLHSSYFDGYYMPESLILRAIVYMYICKYNEMQKTLDIFENTYLPVHHDVAAFLNVNTDPIAYFAQIDRVASHFKEYTRSQQKQSQLALPFMVDRKVMSYGDFKRNYRYIQRLQREQARINSFGPEWDGSGVGRYARRILALRTHDAERTLGFIIRNHLLTMQNNLADFFQQAEFLRYDQLSGVKTALKRKIENKSIGRAHIDDKEARSFYIQNGYDYWPFRGEYWLDEIGNYHYVGVQACE